MSETSHSCPRCSARLTTDRIEEPLAHFDAFACASCGGRFLSQVQLKLIEETVEPRLLEIRHIPPAPNQNIVLDCPACATHPAMDKFEHHRDKKVILDRCPECQGIWLDGGELKAIREESLPLFLANTARYFWDLMKG